MSKKKKKKKKKRKKKKKKKNLNIVPNKDYQFFYNKKLNKKK